MLTYVAHRNPQKLSNYPSNSDAEIEQHTLKEICVFVCVLHDAHLSMDLRLRTAYQQLCSDIREKSLSLWSWGSG